MTDKTRYDSHTFSYLYFYSGIGDWAANKTIIIMKHKLPRLLTLLLTLGASLTNANAQTDSGVTVTIDNVTYNIINGEAEAVQLNWSENLAPELIIPQSVQYDGTSYPVTRIGKSFASGNNNLQKLILPEGLIIIDTWAFQNCKNLSTIQLPSTLRVLEMYVFSSTAVSSINIPASLSLFDVGAFYNCQNLNQISIDAGNMYYSVENGVVMEFKNDKKTLVLHPAGIDRETYTVDGSVTNINAYAFRGCKKLKNINFETNLVSRIDDWTFGNCSNLQTIKLPIGVKSIGMAAFWGCEQLLSISLPSTLVSLGYSIAFGGNTFSGCASLSAITLPASLIHLANGVFDECESLYAINVEPESETFASIDGVLYNKAVTELIEYPEGSSVTDYTLPETVTELPEFAFNNCKLLERVNLHSGLSAIPNYAFANSGIKRVVIPEGVLSIGDNAFYNCKKLDDFYIPENVITVGAKAFAGSNLQGIVLGSRLRNIGEDAFADCNVLRAVTTLSKDIKPGLKMLANCTPLSDGTAKFFVLDADCLDMFKTESAFSGFDIKPLPSYNITAGEGGTIEVYNRAGAPNPYPCMLTDISAQPSSEEYTFENWSSNANQFDGTTDPDLSFSMPLDDFNLKANFTSLSSVSEITSRDIKIMATDTGIEIQGAKWVNVYSVSGNHIYSGVSTVISNLQKGIYIVEADGEISKIALR